MSTDISRFTSALADRYRIERELGAGGMATVYLAEDVKHHRHVAIKVLHAELSAILGPERFLKEIELTASLQHPHILPLFDSGSVHGLLYYVMPYVEGETLRGRLEREKQLPIADAVRIATEVAGALEYAHQRGVIHRDVKPENILLHGGHSLVADFGIALAVQQAGGQRITQTGLSLGTPRYMSPEQAMGEREITARSDIYSLGAVTYEMLAGVPPFTGPTAQAIVAQVITAEPRALTSHRRTVPAPVNDAVMTALEKLPADRFASAAAFAAALQESGTDARRERRSDQANLSSRLSRWSIPLLIAAIALLAVLLVTRRSAAPTGAILSIIAPPTGQTWRESGTAIALSPDGSTLATVASDSATDRDHLVLRRMDRLGTVPVAGTEGAEYPFWSPDGSALGFFAEGQLKRVDLATGTVRTLCSAPAPYGASWGRGGQILFIGIRGMPPSVVSANGGACTPLPLKGPAGVFWGRPYFFPDGQHYILTSFKDAWLGRLGSDAPVLLRGDLRAAAVFAPPDYLLVKDPDGTSLTAQRIDAAAGRLIGAPQRLLDRVESPLGNTTLTASASGDLAAVGPGRPHRSFLLSISRATGAIDSTALAPDLWMIRPSRDGTRLALSGWGFWIFDLARRVLTRAAAELDTGRVVLVDPTWAPHDTAIVLTRQYRNYGFTLFDPRTGSGRNLVLDRGDTTSSVVDWSSDGRYILQEVHGSAAVPRPHIYMYDLEKRAASLLITDHGAVSEARFSPDMHWVAYQSDADGSLQIYARPFPGPGNAVRVSPGGGSRPRWRADGRELFYVGPEGRIMAVSFATGGAIGAPAPAVPGGFRIPPGTDSYEPMPDGQHFVMVAGDAPQGAGFLLAQRWQALLRGGS